MRFRIALGSALVACVVVRLAATSLGSLIDDAFMYLDVARTLGTTGHLWTSGIQPLYLLLITPIFTVLRPVTVAELDAAARACLVVGMIGDLVALLLLARLLWKVGGPIPSAIGAWIWALHPGALEFATNGMETSWALAAFVGVALVAEEQRDVLAGVAVGVAMLARIDLAATGVALAGAILWDTRREITVGLKRVTWLTLGWGVVYVPWLAFQVAQTGDFLPISGAATHLLCEPLRMVVAAEYGVPFTVIMVGLAFAAIEFFAPLVTLGAVASMVRVDLRPLRVPFVAGVVLFVFYAGYHGVTWYLTRYLAPILVVEVALVALGIATLGRVARPAAVGLTLVSCAVLSFAKITTPPPFDYHAAALEARTWGLEGRLAAPESGALSYYLPGQIVNADGVLNREAYIAMRSHRLAQYFEQNGVDRIVERDVLGGLFSTFSAPYSETQEILGQRGFRVVRVAIPGSPETDSVSSAGGVAP